MEVKIERRTNNMWELFESSYLNHEFFDKSQRRVVEGFRSVVNGMNNDEFNSLPHSFAIIMPADDNPVGAIRSSIVRDGALVINPNLNNKPLEEIQARLGEALAATLLGYVRRDIRTYNAKERGEVNRLLSEWNVPLSEGKEAAETW